ncbi:hypothetical protein CLV90_2044 [Maribacter spongiicola]|uniref:Uncharacterized protein n=1 Tax=Maribacter spongiicola TaxID=1206753 RepID=A0A4R7K2V3_9FLAO|nr:hypothetical protein [Maribacter spongiicola]TDT44965.1 hypothetical protein CLV90_2044 [Maribacter spongiicola]
MSSANWWEQTPEQDAVLIVKIDTIISKAKYRNNLKRNGKSKEAKQQEIKNKYRNQFKKNDFEQKWAKLKDSGLIQLDNLESVAKENYHLFNGEAAIYDPKGIKYIKVNLPIGKVDYFIYGTFLKKIGFQFRFCNPDITIQDLNDYLIHLFTTYVKATPKKNFVYDIDLIEKIAQSIFDERSYPVYSKIKVLFNSDYNLNENEKQGIRNKLSGAYKSSQGLDRVEKISQQSNLTQQQMADKIKISLATFKRKLKLLRELQKEQFQEAA